MWRKNVLIWPVLLILSDRLSKFFVMNYGWWQLNRGGVFGMLPGNWWIYVVLVLLLFLSYELMKNKSSDKAAYLILIAAGSSNLIDRIIYGGVVDFIVYPAFGVVGNVADIWLTLGGIIVLINQISNIKPQITN